MTKNKEGILSHNLSIADNNEIGILVKNLPVRTFYPLYILPGSFKMFLLILPLFHIL